MSDTNNTASEVTTKVTGSDLASSEKLELSGERYQFVQVKKFSFKKQDRKKIKDILLTNKFERLEDEAVFLSELEVPEAEVRKRKERKRKFNKQRVDLVEESHKKNTECCLSQFETKNHIHILQEIYDESVEKVQIMKTPKRKLKKCRLCNFKKRSCLLNQGSCQAKKKSCWNCHKIGHFTQSLCCKKKRRNKKKTTNIKLYHLNSEELVKENINLIFQTIRKLENRKSESEEPKENNYSSNENEGHERSKGKLKKGRIQQQIEEEVLKSGKNCARKFEKIRTEDDKQLFLNYCVKTVKQVLQNKCEPLPNSKEMLSLQRKLEVFEKVFYNNDEAILQVDGNCDAMDEEVVPWCLYSVNCDFQSLTTWINFFRSFNILWETSEHCLCTLDIPYPEESFCFFCLMRSSCIRLRNRGQKGPKNLKPYEVISQLLQFERTAGISWLNLTENMEMFIKETIKLLISRNIKTKEVFDPINLDCNTCIQTETFTEDLITEIDTASIESSGPISVEYIMKRFIQKKNLFQCNHELGIESIARRGRLMILSFSNPITMNIPERLFFWKNIFKYKAHIETGDGMNKENLAFFNYEKQMIFQGENKKLHCSEFGPHTNVKMLAFHIVSFDYEQINADLSQNIYNSKVLLHLHKKHLSILNPEADEEKKKMEKVADKKRDQIRNILPERKDMKKISDKKRDLIRNQTPEKKNMMKNADKKRNLIRNKIHEIKNIRI